MAAEVDLTKPRTWAKVRREMLRDDRVGELSAHGVLLRLVITVIAVLDDDRAREGPSSIGWALTADGRPLSARALTVETRLTAAEVEAAIAELVAAGVAVLSEDGAVGLLGWRETQESPSASRMRHHRAKRANAERTDASQPAHDPVTDGAQARHSSVTVTAKCAAEERGEREEELTTTPPTPSPGTPLQLVTLDGAQEGEDPTATAVADAIHGLRVELGLAKGPRRGKVSPAQAKAIRARGRGALRAATRLAESIRRDAERDGVDPRDTGGARYLTLEHVLRPTTIARYDDLDYLDERRPTPARAQRLPPTRASPGTRAPVNGPIDPAAIRGLTGGEDL